MPFARHPPRHTLIATCDLGTRDTDEGIAIEATCIGRTTLGIRATHVIRKLSVLGIKGGACGRGSCRGRGGKRAHIRQDTGWQAIPEMFTASLK